MEESEEEKIAVSLLRGFINTEKQFVEKEHELEDIFAALFHHVFVLDQEVIPDNMTKLHELNGEINDVLSEIEGYLNEKQIDNLQIIREFGDDFKKLGENVEHREWVALRENLEKKSRKELGLKKEELKDLHSMFIKIMKLVKKNKLIKTLEENLLTDKQKSEFKKKEEFYFVQIYKCVKAYERIFRHLWRKERILLKKLK
ncbi:hypothetical protein GOV05_00520 [Candidatus Woesearchaeota archaeon]|nr:hypothetical protein [Candidatus Woesearchaeota archaeon]